jgi:hypothetical protein
VPVGYITLPSKSGWATGLTTVSLTSINVISDCNGTTVPNTTKFTVAANKGTITNADVDAGIAGLQIYSNNGKITINLLTDTVVGTATVIAESVTGDAQGQTSVDFIPPGVSPDVIQKSPADGSINVPTNVTITAMFSEAMNESTIDTSTFRVVQKTSGTLNCTGSPATCDNSKADWSVVNGTVNYDSSSHVASFDPSSNLVTNRCVKVCLMKTIYDLDDGNNLSSTSWEFTVGNTADTTKPTITAPVTDSPDPFSPDGDGTDDTVTVSVTSIADNSELNRWEFVMKDGGTMIRKIVKYTTTNGADSNTWNGSDDQGFVVDNNTYSYEITAYDQAGNASDVWTGGTVTVNNPIIFTHFGP